MPAPIALFVYNRPWHTQQTVEALKQNFLARESDLYVYSDGPRSSSDIEKVEEVRAFVRQTAGFRKVELIENENNQGLAQAIITGVTDVLKSNESIIVLEDDLVTSSCFLTYMNDALAMYKDDDAVISIHGYIYPVKQVLPETFFLRGADCWGWATWRRGWNLFEPDGRKLLRSLNESRSTHAFDFNGSYPYTRMLKKQVRGKNSSWAIRWYAAAFLHNKLTLYPGRSLVRNIGNDFTGTHSWDNQRFDQVALAERVSVQHLKTVEDQEAKSIIRAYFKATAPTILRKVISKLKFLLR